MAAGLAGWGDLLVCEGGNRHAFAGVFDGYGAQASLAGEVEEGVLVQVPRFAHFRGAKLDVEGIGLKEVGDFHGMNDLEGNPIVPIMDGRRP